MRVYLVGFVLLVLAGCDCGPRVTFEEPDSGTDQDSGTQQDSGTEQDSGIPPVNRPPAAADDLATALHGAAVLVDVLANDSDPDGDALTLASVESPASGTATLEAGKVRYAPNTGFVGLDSFGYQVTDGRDGGARGLVRVTVTGPPELEGVVASSDGDLVAISLDGGAQVIASRLDAGTSSLHSPEWSPDGGQLAFIAGGYAWVANGDGSAPRRLGATIGSGGTFQGSARRVTWSPDGMSLAVEAVENGAGQAAVFVIAADGSEDYQLVAVAERGFWSPYSSAVVFSRFDSAREAFYTYRRDLGGAADVELFEGQAFGVSRTGDIVYQVVTDAGTATDHDLWVQPLQGGVATRLLPKNTLALVAVGDEAAWHPSGDSLVLRGTTTAPGGATTGFQMLSVALDGGVGTLYASASTVRSERTCLAWLPDGSKLSFQKTEEPTRDLWLYTPGSGEAKVTTPALFTGSYPKACHHWRLK